MYMQNSKRPLPPHISNRLVDILSNLFLRKNTKEIKLILDFLFTKAERVMILKRIGIHYMLLKGNERNLICEMLKVSSSTVAYHAIQLETQKEEQVALLKSILLSENMKDMLEDIIASILIQPNLYRSHKKIQSNYRIEKERKKYL